MSSLKMYLFISIIEILFDQEFCVSFDGRIGHVGVSAQKFALLENVAHFVHRFRNWATQSANGTDRRGRASDLLQKGII
jgi:hypothetical protein